MCQARPGKRCSKHAKEKVMESKSKMLKLINQERSFKNTLADIERSKDSEDFSEDKARIESLREKVHEEIRQESKRYGMLSLDLDESEEYFKEIKKTGDVLRFSRANSRRKMRERSQRFEKEMKTLTSEERQGVYPIKVGLDNSVYVVVDGDKGDYSLSKRVTRSQVIYSRFHYEPDGSEITEVISFDKRVPKGVNFVPEKAVISRKYPSGDKMTATIGEHGDVSIDSHIHKYNRTKNVDFGIPQSISDDGVIVDASDFGGLDLDCYGIKPSKKSD